MGYAMTTYQRETQLPVIGFDMGGTHNKYTCDVLCHFYVCYILVWAIIIHQRFG